MAFADEAPICTSSARLNFPTGVSPSRSDLSGPSRGWRHLLSFKSGCSVFDSSGGPPCGCLPSLTSGENGPDGTSQLVGHCGNSDVVRPALEQFRQPWPGRRMTRADDSAGTVHEQRAQVAVSSLADAELPYAATCSCLPWRKADGCCELTTIAERRRRSHGGYDRSCSHQTNTRA